VTVADLTRAARGHVPALDGLRGVAILLVLGHALDVVPAVVPAGGAVASAVDHALDLGWIGVQLFFVLSGFLITGILVDGVTRPHGYRDFFVRRLLRIFPLYYAALVVAYVLVPLVATPPPDHGAHQLWLWTYLSNFAAPLGAGEAAFPHVWSLAVEEQFYLVWPFTVGLLVGGGAATTGYRRLAWLSVAMIVAAALARALVRDRLGPAATYSFTPCRMDALALGALAALAVRAPRPAAYLAARATHGPRRLLVGGLALLALALALGKLARTGEVMQVAGYPLIAAASALVLLGAVLATATTSAATITAALAWAPLRAVGRYSYGMYVLHAPLHLYVGLPLLARVGPPADLGAGPGLALALGYVVAGSLATFGLAALTFHLLERPFLALKDRLAPRAG
jgi:peptidoglycan/LPS O-acetylase OafA/YrhL